MLRNVGVCEGDLADHVSIPFSLSREQYRYRQLSAQIYFGQWAWLRYNLEYGEYALPDQITKAANRIGRYGGFRPRDLILRIGGNLRIWYVWRGNSARGIVTEIEFELIELIAP